MHEVSLVEEPERRVIGLGHRGAYAAIGPVFRAVSEAIEAQGLWPEMLEFLGVYRDDPREVPEAELSSMAGIRVRDDLPLPAGLEQMRLPSGRYARVEVRGPYSGLPAAYQWYFDTWLPASGERDRASPSFEVYVNDPGRVSPEELRTLLYLPLA